MLGRAWRRGALPPGAAPATRYLPRAVSAVLLALLAWQSVELVHSLYIGSPDSEAAAPMDLAGYVPPPAAAIDLQAILDGHLFGEYSGDPGTVAPIGEPAGGASAAPTAPDTTLDLHLTATVADSANERAGIAIIASGQTQKVYAVADEIDGTGGVQLHAIYGDRVLLNRSGRLETLRLPEAGATAGGGARLPPALPTPALPAATSAPAVPGVDGNAPEETPPDG